MLVEEILKSPNNTIVDGTYLINDIKLKPFFEKEGHFLTFTLQDKTGTVWAKIWDNAESIAKLLKEVQADVVTIKGRSNVYNNKTQLIVDKIKKADDGTYLTTDLVASSMQNVEMMWTELSDFLDTNITNAPIKALWLDFRDDASFVNKFKIWPGGKGPVHHAYQHGLLEHTLSVLKILKSFTNLSVKVDQDKMFIGGFLHDIGKLEAYKFDVKITMSDIGRLHEHTVLSYYAFRKRLDKLIAKSQILDTDLLEEDIGHIILSHHGTKEQHAVIKPMTLEAKYVAFADLLDSDTNYMSQQIEHNSDDQGWIFDTLQSQFFFKRPEITRIRRKKI
jgi:3'-5' exoribonuclease